MTHDAMLWCRNQCLWLKLQIAAPSCMLCEVVTIYGTPEPMAQQEMYSLMVQVFRQLKQRAEENIQIQWDRKGTSCILLIGMLLL